MSEEGLDDGRVFDAFGDALDEDLKRARAGGVTRRKRSRPPSMAYMPSTNSL